MITGSGGERHLCADVAAGAGLSEDSVLAGRTDLLDLFALVAGAAVVVCGDTGVAHVATAVGTPSVVLFGPTSPAHWGPPEGRRHRVIWKGGRGDPHASTADPGLLRIAVADVMAELDRISLETSSCERMADLSPRLAAQGRDDHKLVSGLATGGVTRGHRRMKATPLP